MGIFAVCSLGSFLISVRQKVGFERATGRNKKNGPAKREMRTRGKKVEMKGKDGDDVEHADESREESERPAGNT